jgi:hypothetical protein
VRSLTPVQAVAILAIGLSVLAVFVPAFARNLRVSRLSEAMDGLQHISRQATLIAQSRQPRDAYPPSVGLTPAQVPQGQAVTDKPDTWHHQTWRELAFSPPQPHRYSFEFQSKNAPDVATFRAIARGDLDGDAVTSHFEITGEYRAGGVPVVYELELDRELE